MNSDSSIWRVAALCLAFIGCGGDAANESSGTDFYETHRQIDPSGPSEKGLKRTREERVESDERASRRQRFEIEDMVVWSWWGIRPAPGAKWTAHKGVEAIQKATGANLANDQAYFVAGWELALCWLYETNLGTFSPSKYTLLGKAVPPPEEFYKSTDPIVLTVLAMMHHRGEGLAKNEDTALKLYLSAVDNFPPAFTLLNELSLSEPHLSNLSKREIRWSANEPSPYLPMSDVAMQR